MAPVSPNLAAQLDAALPNVPRKSTLRVTGHDKGVSKDALDTRVTDAFKDAMKLRAATNPNSLAAPVLAVTGLAENAKKDDPFATASGVLGAVDKFAPALSAGIVGAGLNVLVATTGASKASEKNKDLKEGVKEVVRDGTLDFGEVFKLTSLLQQFAVFWRTMANAIYKSATYGLKIAAKWAPTATAAKTATRAITTAAATPLGRVLSAVNKWIPLLNAVWVMMAMRTAWVVTHDKQSSTTSKVLAFGGVVSSIAAVWAGISTTGIGFFAVTAVSILSDLLLAESRHRDKTKRDTDKRVTEMSRDPGELARTTVNWFAKVGGVIKDRIANMFHKGRPESLIPPRENNDMPRPAPAATVVKQAAKPLKVTGKLVLTGPR